MTNEHDRPIEDRLRDLKSLHDEGLITDDEYATKRELILDQIGVGPPVEAPPPPVLIPPQFAPPPATVVVKQSSGCLKVLLILVVIGLVGIWALASLGTGISDPTSATFANIAQNLSPGSPKIATTTAPELSDQMRVLLDECTQDHATGTVKNNSRLTVDIWIGVNFLENGIIVDDGLDSIDRVRPGETATWEVDRFKDDNITQCRSEISSVFES